MGGGGRICILESGGDSFWEGGCSTHSLTGKGLFILGGGGWEVFLEGGGRGLGGGGGNGRAVSYRWGGRPPPFWEEATWPTLHFWEFCLRFSACLPGGICTCLLGTTATCFCHFILPATWALPGTCHCLPAMGGTTAKPGRRILPGNGSLGAWVSHHSGEGHCLHLPAFCLLPGD